MKPKYGEKAKLCYIDSGSFLTVHIKAEAIYIKKIFNYELEITFPTEKIKK